MPSVVMVKGEKTVSVMLFAILFISLCLVVEKMMRREKLRLSNNGD